jgi:hypothetical protein
MMNRPLLSLCALVATSCGGYQDVDSSRGSPGANHSSLDVAVADDCSNVSPDVTLVALKETKAQSDGPRYGSQSVACGRFVVDIIGAPKDALLTFHSTGQSDARSRADCEASRLYVSAWGWVPNHRSNEEAPGHWTLIADSVATGLWTGSSCTLAQSTREPYSYPDLRVAVGAVSDGTGAGWVRITTM